GLFECTRQTTAQCAHAYRARRRFHACRTWAWAPPRLPADHAWPHYSASGNRSNLLPEYPLLRTADLDAELTLRLLLRLRIRSEGRARTQFDPLARLGLKQSQIQLCYVRC